MADAKKSDTPDPVVVEETPGAAVPEADNKNVPDGLSSMGTVKKGGAETNVPTSSDGNINPATGVL